MKAARATLPILTLAVLLAFPATAGAQIFGVSERDEIRAGQQAARQIEREVPILGSGPWPGYIQRLGRELAAFSDRPELPYHFRIIDRSDVNAFALPGGYIYVYRGLLELARDEAEVAGVLAHEIAHASERHHVEQARKASGVSLGIGILDAVLGRRKSGLEQLGLIGAQIAGGGAVAKFSRDAEREADREAVYMMRRAGLNPDAMITLFARMDEMNRRRPGAIGGFFATHPSLRDRQDNVDGLLQRSDASLPRTSPEFERLPRL